MPQAASYEKKRSNLDVHSIDFSSQMHIRAASTRKEYAFRGGEMLGFRERKMTKKIAFRGDERYIFAASAKLCVSLGQSDTFDIEM